MVLMFHTRFGHGTGHRDLKERNMDGLRQRKSVMEDVPEDDSTEAAQVDEDGEDLLRMIIIIIIL